MHLLPTNARKTLRFLLTKIPTLGKHGQLVLHCLSRTSNSL